MDENGISRIRSLEIGEPTDHEAHLDLAAQAFAHAPEEVIAALGHLVDKDQEAGGGRYGYERRLRSVADPRFVAFLNERLARPHVAPDLFESLLVELAHRDRAAALAAARARVTVPAPAEALDGRRAAHAALWLLTHAGGSEWEQVWRAIDADEQFGHVFVGLAAQHRRRDPLRREGVATDDDEAPFTHRLSEAAVADLFLWTIARYPVAALASAGEWVKLDNTGLVSRFRDGLIYSLQTRATAAAVAALERVADVVKSDWINRAIAAAREALRRASWRPPTPEQVLRLAADPRARTAASGEQLTGAIIESLERFELDELLGRGLDAPKAGEL